MLSLVKLYAKCNILGDKMSAKLYKPNFKKSENDNKCKPLLSMFMVRRQGDLKVITNLAQLTPAELINALIQDAVRQESENSALKKLAEF